MSSNGPGPVRNGERNRFGYGTVTTPATYWVRMDVTLERSLETPAVRQVDSPWYWPRKVRMSGRPVASRMNLTAPSTARVPVTEYSTRLSRPGAIDASLSTSSSAGTFWIHPLICIPCWSQASSIAARTRLGVGPKGEAPPADMWSAKVLSSTSTTRCPRRPAWTNGTTVWSARVPVRSNHSRLRGPGSSVRT